MVHPLPSLVAQVAALAAVAASAAALPESAKAPVRSRSEVDRRGREVIAALGGDAATHIGILDVTQPPYGADPSGRVDATQALQRAIDDARDARLAVFLPAGRYLVSDTLVGLQGTVLPDQWMFGDADPMVRAESRRYPCVLIGPPAGQRAVIELAARAPGFGDPAHPKPVVYFWARRESRSRATGRIDSAASQPNISFNQQIRDVDFDLGGNPGAIAIDHQGAQWSVVEDVSIEATGAFAGIRGLCGSGGGVHGLTVHGGRYGVYASRVESFRGSQPVPVLSTVRLTGQTEAAILYDGRGPLTVVGADIDGAGIEVVADPKVRFNGALNLVDATLRIRDGRPAIRTRHSVVLSNAWFAGTDRLVARGDATLLPAAAAAKVTHVGQWAVGDETEGAVATTVLPPVVESRADDEWPRDLPARHDWAHPCGDWLHAANVRDPAFGAKGDGTTDDTAALQHAIDTADVVFVPRGEYLISRPLRLRPATQLVGIGTVYSVIVARTKAPAFCDPRNPQPLVESADDAAATTMLANLELRVPVMATGAYALRWRAGRHSVVRDVNFERTFWDPDAPGLFHPFVRIDGHGGGRWFNFNQCHWWSQGPLYRHLLVDGTREPLAFYMLNPEHGRCEVQAELRNARNVDIFGLKGEGNYPLVRMTDCEGIRLFGYGGNGVPWPGWSVLDFVNCRDVLLANLAPQIIHHHPGVQSALAMAVGPEGSFLVRDGGTRVPMGGPVTVFRIAK